MQFCEPLVAIGDDLYDNCGTSESLVICKCYQAALNLEPSPELRCYIYYRLGSLLIELNAPTAIEHLQKCVKTYQDSKLPSPISLNLPCQACWKITNYHLALNKPRHARDVLSQLQTIAGSGGDKDAVYQSTFKLVEISDRPQVAGILSTGIDYILPLKSAFVEKSFLLLYRAAFYLSMRSVSDSLDDLDTVKELILNTDFEVENIKEYFQSIQLLLRLHVSLLCGKVSSSKDLLKDLQHLVQVLINLSSCTDPEITKYFYWLKPEHILILIYLVTCIYHMMAGTLERAKKYTEKAFFQIEKLKSLNDSSDILISMHIILLENAIQSHLVMGNKVKAIAEIAQICKMAFSNNTLMRRHGPQIHTLLGLYSMCMNNNDAAQNQFKLVLKTTKNQDLFTFCALNLSLIYLRVGSRHDLQVLLDRTDPSGDFPSCSLALKSAAYYVRSLHAFYQANYIDAKRFLRNTITLTSAEDVNRLTTCSLVLLGHIYLNDGNSEESQNVIVPAMQLASKIPDLHVQLWACALIETFLQLFGSLPSGYRGDPPEKTKKSVTNHLLNDYNLARKCIEHNLIHWQDENITARTLEIIQSSSD